MRLMDRNIPVPIGVILAALAGAFGFAGSGVVGDMTRGGDLDAVKLMVSDQVRDAIGESQKATATLVDEKLSGYDRLQGQRYDEMLRRFDRIDSRLDKMDGR